MCPIEMLKTLRVTVDESVKINPHGIHTKAWSISSDLSKQKTNTVLWHSRVSRFITWQQTQPVQTRPINPWVCLLNNNLSESSELDIKTKISIHNILPKPARTYGVQLLDVTKKSKTNNFQIFRLITDAHSYRTIFITTSMFYSSKMWPHFDDFRFRLFQIANPLVLILTSRSLPSNRPRRFERQWPNDFRAL